MPFPRDSVGEPAQSASSACRRRERLDRLLTCLRDVPQVRAPHCLWLVWPDLGTGSNCARPTLLPRRFSRAENIKTQSKVKSSEQRGIRGAILDQCRRVSKGPSRHLTAREPLRSRASRPRRQTAALSRAGTRHSSRTLRTCCPRRATRLCVSARTTSRSSSTRRASSCSSSAGTDPSSRPYACCTSASPPSCLGLGWQRTSLALTFALRGAETHLVGVSWSELP